MYNTLHNKPWLTQGIKISCINKGGLFVICRNNNDPIRINYYKTYSRSLATLLILLKNSTIKNFWLIQLIRQKLLGISSIIILIGIPPVMLFLKLR